MTQDERWLAKCNEAVDFIEINHSNPRVTASRTFYAELAQSHKEKEECWDVEGTKVEQIPDDVERIINALS